MHSPNKPAASGQPAADVPHVPPIAPLHLVLRDGRLQPAGYVDTATAAAYAGYSKSVFDKLRQTGDGPEFFGPTSDPRYTFATVDEWMNRHRYTSTAAMREAKRTGGAA